MSVPKLTLTSVQEEQAALYYFGTLYYLIGNFPRTGLEVLQHNGYRNRAWVESLYQLAAEHGCFGREEPTKVVLPFEVVQPLITPEIVALVCLADDLLRATYYEYCIIRLRDRILGGSYINRKSEHVLKQIRQARQKLCLQKREYLRVAYGKSLKSIRQSYDMNHIYLGDELQKTLLDTFDFVPAVFRLYPRDVFSADLSPLTHLYRKYKDIFLLCKESDSLPPV